MPNQLSFAGKDNKAFASYETGILALFLNKELYLSDYRYFGVVGMGRGLPL